MVSDLSGQVFGRLTVLEYAGSYRWKCRCDCGITKEVRTADLVRGKVKSCGCLKKELIRKRRLEDLTGMRFGRLTVIGIGDGSYNNVKWKCRCDCGNTVNVKSSYLKCGDTQSCGCLAKDKLINRSTTHGMSNSCRLYNVWKGMKERCYNQSSDCYANYGARGISVCNEWNDFKCFYDWAVEHGYSEDKPTYECTLDRIDTNGDYTPDNCRWVSMKDQARNKRNNRLIAYHGQTKTAAEWEEITNIPAAIITQRLCVNGWSVEDALTIGRDKYGNRRTS